VSRENVEIVLRALRAASALPKTDFATVNQLFDPDHVFVPANARGLGEREAHGAEGYRAWRHDWGT
jgi:hypothetical protein